LAVISTVPGSDGGAGSPGSDGGGGSGVGESGMNSLQDKAVNTSIDKARTSLLGFIFILLKLRIEIFIFKIVNQ
jgi:hypothetical protein